MHTNLYRTYAPPTCMKGAHTPHWRETHDRHYLISGSTLLRRSCGSHGGMGGREDVEGCLAMHLSSHGGGDGNNSMCVLTYLVNST